MLEPTLHALSSMRVILASGSPRRREIIKNLGINVECITSKYDENLDRSKYNNHGDYVQDLAYYKVQDVFNNLKTDSAKPSLILGADTIVTLGDEIFGKPKDAADAVRILSSKQGTCCLHRRLYEDNGKEIKFYQSAKVTVGDISKEQIESYVKTGEPMDKAGGYGIQGTGGCLIESINGDFYTVMGMPLYTLVKNLNQLYSSK